MEGNSPGWFNKFKGALGLGSVKRGDEAENARREYVEQAQKARVADEGYEDISEYLETLQVSNDGEGVEDLSNELVELNECNYDFSEHPSAFTPKNLSEDNMYPNFGDKKEIEKAQENGCYLIADGLGSSTKPDLASGIAREVVEMRLAKIDKDIDGEDAEEMVKKTMIEINQKIGIANEKLREIDPKASSSTTCLIAKVAGNTLVIGMTGDSVIYRARGGKIEKVISEDSFVAYLEKYGILKKEDDQNEKISLKSVEDLMAKVQAKEISMPESDLKIFQLYAQRERGSKRIANTRGGIRNVMFTALNGDPNPQIRTTKTDIKNDDVYIMASDGLGDNITSGIMEKLFEISAGDTEKFSYFLTEWSKAMMNYNIEEDNEDETLRAIDEKRAPKKTALFDVDPEIMVFWKEETRKNSGLLRMAKKDDFTMNVFQAKSK
ncbi:protein phosphatase 2C domain-containing protein [Patescibacteria group bacterium]|nr:protein phosphatase 2C domain-containing protein [Patescibacteria group bacterium]MBU1612914.1 protein phosphatase 2C domain-containing protein [Patescibacteria group bacterium]